MPVFGENLSEKVGKLHSRIFHWTLEWIIWKGDSGAKHGGLHGWGTDCEGFSEFPLLNSCFYVIVQEPPEEKTEDANAGKFVASSLLFSNAAKASGLFPLTKYYLAIGRLTIIDHHHSDDESEKKTLSESAAEYTESHTNKRKYDVVDVVTGDCQNNLLA